MLFWPGGIEQHRALAEGHPSGDVHAARTEPALRPLATWLVITSEKGSTYLSQHLLAMKP